MRPELEQRACSFGAATTYEVALNDRVRDDRIRAAIVMAGPPFTNSEDGSFVVSNVPVYLLHGSADPAVPIDISRHAFHSFRDNAYFATLVEGGHSGPFEDETAERPKVPGMDVVVTESTTAFWDRYLLDDPAAAERLTASANVNGLSVLAQKDLCALGLIGDAVCRRNDRQLHRNIVLTENSIADPLSGTTRYESTRSCTYNRSSRWRRTQWFGSGELHPLARPGAWPRAADGLDPLGGLVGGDDQPRV